MKKLLLFVFTAFAFLEVLSEVNAEVLSLDLNRSYISTDVKNDEGKIMDVTANFAYQVTVKNKKITNAYGTCSNGIIWNTNLGKSYFTSTTSGV